jgi:hypothetical protein
MLLLYMFLAFVCFAQAEQNHHFGANTKKDGGKCGNPFDLVFHVENGGPPKCHSGKVDFFSGPSHFVGASIQGIMNGKWTGSIHIWNQPGCTGDMQTIQDFVPSHNCFCPDSIPKSFLVFNGVTYNKIGITFTGTGYCKKDPHSIIIEGEWSNDGDKWTYKRDDIEEGRTEL